MTDIKMFRFSFGRVYDIRGMYDVQYKDDIYEPTKPTLKEILATWFSPDENDDFYPESSALTERDTTFLKAKYPEMFL